MENDNTSGDSAQFASLVQALDGTGPGPQGMTSLLSLIVDTLPLGFYVVDSGKIAYFNERFCEIWGLGRLKDKMWDGRLTGHDIAVEMVRQIDGESTQAWTGAVPNSHNNTAEVRELRLTDGRVIRHINAGIPVASGLRQGVLNMFEDVTEQAVAQENIRKGQERYKELADALPQIVFEMDLTGNISFLNQSAYALMGVNEHDVELGFNALDWVVPEERDWMRTCMMAAAKGGHTGNEHTFLRRDGSRMPVIIHSRAIVRNGQAVGLRGVVFDITEQKQNEEKLRQSLEERERLLKEINHRVRNNLQVIASLLNLQMAFVDDFVAISLLRESQSRVRTIALAHEQLYGSCDLAMVSFRGFVQALVAQVADSCRITPDRYRLAVEGDDFPLEPDVAVPCGLVLGELVSGSFGRAIGEGRKDELRVVIRGGDRVVIDLEDDGKAAIGAPGLGEPLPMGMQLVYMMIEQLEGTLQQESTTGMNVHIEFPAKGQYSSRPAR